MNAREYFPGVGQAVADRTVNRPGEKWGDVARRVALGNSALVPFCQDREPLEAAIADGRMLLSGRHLQHGDAEQPNRNMEVFTNCSTSAQRALGFYLMLNGSGVGTSYDDDMCIVDWSRMPKVHILLRSDHADNDGSWPENFYGVKDERPAVYFRVPDSREGWAEAIMQIEDMAFTKDERDLVLDFSDVRPKGSPIGGMQERPSSGPIPLMEAIQRAQEQVRGQRMPLWEQAMLLDHLFAEIVLVGGARRAARIACKWWGDEDILAFINIKQTGGHWTANNSVGVDADFWSMVKFYRQYGYAPTNHHQKAWDVYVAVTEAQYRHGTGEPAFLNMDLLSAGETPPSEDEALHLGGKLDMTSTSINLRAALMRQAAGKKYCVIVNPCGEIRLSVNGGYCVIGDIAVAHCKTQDQFNEAARLMTRALIRTNTMPALYQGEVRRTNRIGVALTGIFEYAWLRFGLTFHDLVEEDPLMPPVIDANERTMPMPTPRALAFWMSLHEAAKVVAEECISYSDVLGVSAPVTSRTIKPAGTTSKLFGLTEGAHLPAMAVYLRWVQFRDDDPLVAEYEAKGYPIRRDLKSYKNVVIIGFPTCLPIGADMGDKLVTATQATFAQQIRWIRLLETFWLLADGGNQVSYTLKYDPKVVDEEEYQALVLEHVPNVRAVSVMPQTDAIQYEYQPEEAISMKRYHELVATIERAEREDVGQEHVDACATGACPISFDNRSLSKVVNDGAMG